MEITLVYLTIIILNGIFVNTDGGDSDGHSFQRLAFTRQEASTVMQYITPSAGQTCTFQLSYQGMIFNHNGTFVSSARYPYSHRRRTKLQAHSLFDYLLLVLTIENTRPSDTGRYRCSFECTRMQSYQEHELQVYYPPAPATCLRAEENTLFGISYLECSAENGYPSGYIICYVNEIGNSPVKKSAGEMLKASFWFTANSNVYCCSLNDEYTKTFSTCTDFILEIPVSTNTKLPTTTDYEVRGSTSLISQEINRHTTYKTSKITISQSPNLGSSSIYHGSVLVVTVLFSVYIWFQCHG